MPPHHMKRKQESEWYLFFLFRTALAEIYPENQENFKTAKLSHLSLICARGRIYGGVRHAKKKSTLETVRWVYHDHLQKTGFIELKMRGKVTLAVDPQHKIIVRFCVWHKLAV